MQDVVFAREIIEWMTLNSCLDPSNVFATGFSNGGMITNRVGCQLSQLFKGIAPAAASPFRNLPLGVTSRPFPDRLIVSAGQHRHRRLI